MNEELKVGSTTRSVAGRHLQSILVPPFIHSPIGTSRADSSAAVSIAVKSRIGLALQRGTIAGVDERFLHWLHFSLIMAPVVSGVMAIGTALMPSM